MWIWRAETGLVGERSRPPRRMASRATSTGSRLTRANPALGYAVGQSGALLKYDKTWTQEEELPAGLSRKPNFTSVAFAGSEAMVVAEHDLLVKRWLRLEGRTRSPCAARELAEAPQLERRRRASRTAAPCLPGATSCSSVTALERRGTSLNNRSSTRPRSRQRAAGRLEGARRAVGRARLPVSAAARAAAHRTRHATTADPPQPAAGRRLPAARNPGGWEDEERAAYAGDSEDKPVKADPIAALDLGPGGRAGRSAAGVARPTTPGAEPPPSGTGQTIRENVQTAGIYSYAPEGNPPAPPGDDGDANSACRRGVATFAVAGHAECVEPCAASPTRGSRPTAT